VCAGGVSGQPRGQQHFTINLGATKIYRNCKQFAGSEKVVSGGQPLSRPQHS